MIYLALDWLLSSLSLLLLSYLIPGFRINGFESALIACTSVGLVCAILGLLLKDVGSPVGLTISATFLFMVTGFVFRLSALLVPGYIMLGFVPALVGAAVIVGLQFALRSIPARSAALDSEESWLRS